MASYITDGKLYIRMRQNKAETCTLSKAQIFDDEKAENILNCMPRTLQKFHFRVKRIHNNDLCELNETVGEVESKIIDINRAPDSNVEQWVSKIKEIREQAEVRRVQLKEELKISEAKLCDILHEIELEGSLNACAGFKQYKKIKSALEQRRKVKDESMIVNMITSSNYVKFADEIVTEYEKMGNRVYHYRAKNGKS